MNRIQERNGPPRKRCRPTLLPLEGRRLLSSDVLTYHDDNFRSGADLDETILTPSNVNAATFGKVGFDAVDGKVDAQPLYASAVAIPGAGTHDVLYVATENDSLYAFDAADGSLLWHDGPSTLLGTGEAAVHVADYLPKQVNDQYGFLATPVIDPTTGILYAEGMSVATVAGKPVFHQRLYAIDIATGATAMPPVSLDPTIRVPGTGPGGDGTDVFFSPEFNKDRAALTLSNGIVYTAWSSQSGVTPYTGWVIGFHASDLSLASAFDTDPNGTPVNSDPATSSGGSFWNSGSGFAVDAQGDLYNVTGNGPFDASRGNYGDTVLKLSAANGLTVADSFTPYNQHDLANADRDLGSGGILLLPDLKDASGNTVHLAINSAKDGNIYITDRDHLGGYDTAANDIRQEIVGALRAVFAGSPAYYNGQVYFGANGQPLRAFTFKDAVLSETPTSQTSGKFDYPGTTPSVSADGDTDGIVWAVENNTVAAVLHAYDANNLAVELYDSNQAPVDRDMFGPDLKFIVPTIAAGRVYVGTPTGVAVFGLLPVAPNPEAPTAPVSSDPTPSPTAPPGLVVPAFASPNFLVGGINFLVVVGSDPATGDASLTYTWSAIAEPAGAPAPAFSANGTRTSNFVSVATAVPGSYTFRVTISDPSGRSSTSDVAVIVGFSSPTVVVPAFASAAPTPRKPTSWGQSAPMKFTASRR